jgi:hypothetical protein
MAGLEPNTIYVNLDLTADAPGPSEPLTGAPLCGYASMNQGGPPTGTEDFPLSFNQFRKHVQYRLTQNETGKTRTYIIAGSYTGTIDYGSGGFNTGIFNVNYVPTSSADAYTVIFKNRNVDESYKMNISAKSSSALLHAPIISPPTPYNPPLYFLNTSGVIMYISGMDLESETFTDKNETRDIGDIIFNNAVVSSDYNSHNFKNQLEMSNCRFYTQGGGVYRLDGNTDNINSYQNAYAFNNYVNVTLFNCLFHSNNSGTMCFKDYPVSNPTAISWNLYYDIINTIFLDIVTLYRVNNIQSLKLILPNDIYSNVFSGALSGYTGATIKPTSFTKLLEDGSTDSQFDFPIPALTYGTTLTNDDYRYINNGWENIDVIGDRYNSTKNSVYGFRDGVGPLYFPELPIPIITASDFITTVGSTITLGIEDYVNYNLLYEPSLYGWYKNNNAAPFAVGGEPASHDVPLAITTKGIIPIEVRVHSHNDWYTVKNYTSIRSLINQSTITLSLKTNNSNGVNTDTFIVNDSVQIEVNATPDTDVKSYWINFDGTWINARIYTVKFKSIGPVNILGRILLKDGTMMYTSKTINIAEYPSKTYYVDLSIEYENKLKFKLNNVIYDNFEDQSIDPAFSTPFKNDYLVKRMYDEYVASYYFGTTNAQMTTGILNGNFNVEWSFVRDTESSNPKMIVNIDGMDISAEWNYIDNLLNIFNGDSILYRIPYGPYSPDLSCPNALHKMFCKFVMINGNFSFMYSVDGTTYKDRYLTKYTSFSLASVNADADSHSGYGVVFIEADNVNTQFGNGLALVKGSEEYPFTYPEMVVRISPNGTGVFADIYKCRYWRETKDYLESDKDKQFHIDVWNPDKYGPWMLRFYMADVNLTGTTLSNGIICNIPSYPTPYQLHITTTYNMFITWNGSKAKIILEKYFNRYTGKDKRVDIIGSTIKSEGGFLTGG